MRLGQTSTSLYVVLRDPASGAVKTGLTYADAFAGYVRPGAAAVWSAAVSLASPAAAFVPYGFVELDAANLPGVYRVDLPDAAFVAGVRSVAIALRPAGAAFAPVVAVEELADSPSPVGLVVLRNATTAPATGLTYADVQVGYARAGAAAVWGSAVELAAPTAAYAANGFVEIDAATLPGLYRVDWPAAALAAAGVDRVLLAAAPLAGGFAATVTLAELVDATILPAAGQVFTDVPFGDPAAPQTGTALLAQETPMSVILRYQVKATVTETLETGMTLASDKSVTYNGLDTAVRTLNADSTPPVTKAAVFPKPLVDGAGSIDLAALTGANGAAVNGTGLRVQLLRLTAPAANTGPITISKGAANGYDGFGASFSLAVGPGEERTLLNNDSGTDIGAANKALDLAGTGTESLNVEIVMG